MGWAARHNAAKGRKMRRLTLTCHATRVLEMHLTTWSERRDDKGKFLADARERRRWNRMADKFVEAAGEYDHKCHALTTDLVAFIDSCASEQAAMAEALAESIRNSDATTVTVEDIEKLQNLRINARTREINAQINIWNDDPALGAASCEVDLDDDDPKWLLDTWEKVDAPNDRATRKVVNIIINALESAVELVKDGDRYVPKRPVLVEKAG